MSILSGYFKTKRYRMTDTGYKLQSEWTSSDTVEMSNGKTLTENVDTTLSVSGAFADAKAVGDAIANVAIETDATLTVEGAAADAKAVGDKLNGMSTPINAINMYYDPETDIEYKKNQDGEWVQVGVGGLIRHYLINDGTMLDYDYQLTNHNLWVERGEGFYFNEANLTLNAMNNNYRGTIAMQWLDSFQGYGKFTIKLDSVPNVDGINCYIALVYNTIDEDRTVNNTTQPYPCDSETALPTEYEYACNVLLVDAAGKEFTIEFNTEQPVYPCVFLTHSKTSGQTMHTIKLRDLYFGR